LVFSVICRRLILSDFIGVMSTFPSRYTRQDYLELEVGCRILGQQDGMEQDVSKSEKDIDDFCFLSSNAFLLPERSGAFKVFTFTNSNPE